MRSTYNVPRLYQGTDLLKLPKQFQDIIASWEYGPTGIGFVGKAGTCKTRAAYLLMDNNIIDIEYVGGIRESATAFTSTELACLAVDQFSDDPNDRDEAKRYLKRAKRDHLLLIDDIGKGKMTERAEVELYDILEYRTSNMLPTIWTANMAGDELRKILSKDRGDPIMRRLMEFSTIIKA